MIRDIFYDWSLLLSLLLILINIVFVIYFIYYLIMFLIVRKSYHYRLRYKHLDCKINFKEGTYNYFWTAKIAKIIYQANFPNRKYWISKDEKSRWRY